MTFSSGDDDDDTMNDLSEDESEIDDIVDNLESYNSVENDEDSEDWDLPEGVNYDDTPCSAPQCRNPVGERVDWVREIILVLFAPALCLTLCLLSFPQNLTWRR